MEPQEKVVDAINGFSINLYKKLTEAGMSNLVCSGYSVHCVLNLVLAGARGLTSQELNKILGYENCNLSVDDVATAFRKILDVQNDSSSGYDLDVANSVWIESGAKLDANFTSRIQKTFDVEERQVDFSKPVATDEINNWVKQKTKGRIPSLFDDPLDKDTLLVLVNAVYFKGKWSKQFKKNQSVREDFFSGSNPEKVLMMKIVDDFYCGYSEDLDAQILELPYIGNDVSMFILLPKANDGLEAMERKLTAESLTSALGSLDICKVHVSLPKFSVSSKIPLEKVLQSLGIVQMFTPGGADLSGINGMRNLYVSKAIQKADIEVNEEGTVAAAATGVAVANYCARLMTEIVHFVANHPFLYILRQESTKVILFCGRVNHPAF